MNDEKFSAKPVQDAWRDFTTQMVSILDSCEQMGMSARNVAECYRAIVEAKLAIDGAFRAVNKISDELQQWKDNDEWEVRTIMMQAAKLGLGKPGTLS